MTPARLRMVLLGATALLAGLVLLAWSQPWFTLSLTSGGATTLEVRGDVAAGGLAPLALAVLAVIAALALAGPVFRAVFGVLEALLGGSIVAVALVAVGDPVAASASAVTDATGIAGAASVTELVEAVAVSAWPAAAIALGVAVGVVGVVVAATARRWPTSGRRYGGIRTRPDQGTVPDPVAEWDALSDGDDPTS